MSGLIITALVFLVFIVIYQIAKASEYATVLRGEEKVKAQTNRLIAWLMVAFFILGMYGIYKCHVDLMDKMLPVSASNHGEKYEEMLKVTLILTGIVFFITQALLFWFVYRYQSTEKRTSFFFPHNNKLELLWTVVPALALVALVVVGLRNWFTFTSDAPKGAQIVEVVGKQFNWIVRYPGPDGILGKTDYTKTDDATNVLGIDWSDPASKDDIVLQNGELHIVKNKDVQLVIRSRDVIHDVGLPHFRLKMDAVPGIVTTMWFKPLYTTKEMQRMTHDPEFVYEISCDQMCGKGHYSMRGTVIVETPEEHADWAAKQQPYYASAHAPAAPAEGAAAPAGTDTTKTNTVDTTKAAVVATAVSGH